MLSGCLKKYLLYGPQSIVPKFAGSCQGQHNYTDPESYLTHHYDPLSSEKIKEYTNQDSHDNFWHLGNRRQIGLPILWLGVV